MIDETDKPQSEDSAERATDEAAAPRATDPTAHAPRRRNTRTETCAHYRRGQAKPSPGWPPQRARRQPRQAAPPAATTDHADARHSDEEKRPRGFAEARAKAAAFKQTAAEKAGAAGTPPGLSSPLLLFFGGRAESSRQEKEEGAKLERVAAPLVKVALKSLKSRRRGLEATEFLGQLSVRVAPLRIVEVCEFLKRDAESPFDYLSDLTCVHFPENADAPFEVVYNLYSISANVRVRLKAQTTDAVGVESVTGVWPAANWLEREVYDLFGVQFRNHPDLRRLLLPPDWEGYPLRKDYPLEPVENNWTAKHLPEFSDVQHAPLKNAAHRPEAFQAGERRVSEIFTRAKNDAARRKYRIRRRDADEKKNGDVVLLSSSNSFHPLLCQRSRHHPESAGQHADGAEHGQQHPSTHGVLRVILSRRGRIDFVGHRLPTSRWRRSRASSLPDDRA